MSAGKRLIIAAMILPAAVVFFAPAAPARDNAGCAQMLDGILCPPPNGGIASGIDGEVVCGPGQCARDQNGVVQCSAVPGGSAIVDINGQVLCVGGCVSGARRQCVVPTR